MFLNNRSRFILFNNMCFCYLFVCTTTYRFLCLLHVYVFVVVFVARRVTLYVRSPIVFAAVGPLAAGCPFWQVRAPVGPYPAQNPEKMFGVDAGIIYIYKHMYRASNSCFFSFIPSALFRIVLSLCIMICCFCFFFLLCAC